MHNHYKDQFFSLGGGEGVRVCECHLEANMMQAWQFYVRFCTTCVFMQDQELNSWSISSSGPDYKKERKKNKNSVCLSICWILSYYVNEVDGCCGVQVPVQLV